MMNLLPAQEGTPNAYPAIMIDDAIEALIHLECQQNPDELSRMLEIIRGRKSLLEIGSNFGGTLKRMAAVLAPQSNVVSVDMVQQGYPFVDPFLSLKDSCQSIANMGHHVKLFTGDSHSEALKSLVAKEAPFDFGFIDGDHSYSGVKQDWIDYGPMCKVVGFHDIGGTVEGCVRFWEELKKEIDGRYRYVEFKYPKQLRSGHMFLGIGIVFRDGGND